MKMMTSHACVVAKNFNLEAEELAVAVPPLGPPSPPPLPPAKKPKQGIGSILGSDSDHRASRTASIRRTLSADMSSKKWLSHNGFSTMQKTASSAEFADDHHSGEEDDVITNRPGQDEVWRAIQAQKLHEHRHIKQAPLRSSSESWSSILLSQKTADPSELPPPYVHPLMKRTTSSLSEKSLEICTESLGSETGSEGFSFSSESGDEEEEKDGHQQTIHTEDQETKDYLKQSYSKRSQAPRSFPPPLPSLAKNRASVQVLSRRQNGRLILEAVSVPPRNYLHAERQDGRLLLTLVSASEETEDENEETGDNEKKETETAVDQNPKFSPLIKQITGLNFKKNTLWSNSNNKAVNFTEVVENLIITPLPAPGVARLIPAPPPANTYDYFWRKKPTVASVIDTTYLKSNKNNKNVVESPKCGGEYEQKENVVLLRQSKANNMIPMLRGCKETRRSLLLWEPYCIATT